MRDTYKPSYFNPDEHRNAFKVVEPKLVKNVSSHRPLSIMEPVEQRNAARKYMESRLKEINVKF
jgi:hypothetical protein